MGTGPVGSVLGDFFFFFFEKPWVQDVCVCVWVSSYD